MGSELQPGPQVTEYTPDEPFDKRLLTKFNHTFGVEAVEAENGTTAFKWKLPVQPEWVTNGYTHVDQIDLHPEAGYVALHRKSHGGPVYDDPSSPGMRIDFDRITVEEMSQVMIVESVPENNVQTVFTIPVRGPLSSRRRTVPSHLRSVRNPEKVDIDQSI